MRPCRFCGRVFFICRRCDRGHAYCGDACRAKGRARTVHEARARHQRSDEGRLDHRDRMRAYRERRGGGVTDQGREAPVVSGKVRREEATDAIESIPRLRTAQRCIVCGRRSRFARWHLVEQPR